MKKKPIPEVIREPFLRSRWYVRPGVQPAGYQCGNLKIMRRRGETVEELRQRCRAAVIWPDVDAVMVFVPL